MSNFPEHIFRAYDIRGIALGDEPEITPDFARNLARAFVAELGIDSPKLVVGRDNRLTGESLRDAFVEGLVIAGAHVVDIDFATSPYFYFAVCDGEFDGGAMITASHNPADFNGFKLVGRGAMPLESSAIQNLAKQMQSKDLPETDGGAVESADFKKNYLNKLASLAPVARPLKVVVECGEGAAGFFAPQLFHSLGCEVVELGTPPDGNFPRGVPNPEDAESLAPLSAAVVENSADLGVAFDGDGDRVGVVDEAGNFVSPDRLIVLLARDLLTRNPGNEIVFDIKCSQILESEIAKAGGQPQRWKTGHSFIKKKMKEDGALLAGEVSGHIFFAENYFGVDDGLLAAAKIVSLASQSDSKFSELFADLPKTATTPELKLPIADAIKFQTVEKIVADFSAKFENVDQLDGARVVFSDGGWGLIRASNTSPYLTARFEAADENRLAEVKKIFADELQKYDGLDISKLEE